MMSVQIVNMAAGGGGKKFFDEEEDEDMWASPKEDVKVVFVNKNTVQEKRQLLLTGMSGSDILRWLDLLNILPTRKTVLRNAVFVSFMTQREAQIAQERMRGYITSKFV